MVAAPSNSNYSQLSEDTGSSDSSLATTDPFARPAQLTRRCSRLLSLLFGITHAAAIGLGFLAPLQSKSEIVVAPDKIDKILEQPAEDDLWRALGSEDLTATLLAAREQQAEEELAAAEQARLQAQQLLIDTENRAENLVTGAAYQARQRTVGAIRQADAIHLDATYIGAEQVIYADGDEITLKFAARIQCKEGSFGETAIATPLDPRISPREVRNLANCYPNPEAAAGQPIGEAGEWGVAFFKSER